MGAIVDYQFYTDVFGGTEADAETFPALSARALDIVGAVTRWRVTENNIDEFPELIQTLYRKAVCTQVDFFAVNGLDLVNVATNTDNGFTVGKVSVHGRSGITASGAMSGNVAPMALMYLEQTGLMNPAVPVSGLYAGAGWWY